MPVCFVAAPADGVRHLSQIPPDMLLRLLQLLPRFLGLEEMAIALVAVVKLIHLLLHGVKVSAPGVAADAEFHSHRGLGVEQRGQTFHCSVMKSDISFNG